MPANVWRQTEDPAEHEATFVPDLDLDPASRRSTAIDRFRILGTQALETEWRGRHQRGVESRLKLARLPWVKTLDQFDFEFQPSIDRRQVRELAGLSFVERAENVVLLGPPDPET